MRFCYAHRRATLYPTSLDSWNLAPDDYTAAFLCTAKDIGFDAIEVGVEVLERTGGSERQVKAFGQRLLEAGMPIGCVRAGGTLTDARHGPRNRARQASAIQFAGWVGAAVVNTALSAPARRPGHPAGSLPGSQHGWPVAQDASRDAQLSEYEALAKACQPACDQAADAGVTISVEVHQNSLVDNSWSARLIHRLVDRRNFGINPDLGNVYWTYDVPEETPEDCIRQLAPISVYWHCKNLYRVYHPEMHRSVFLRAPLPDGEIDYRFAVAAMHAAGYAGYMAIERRLGGGPVPRGPEESRVRQGDVGGARAYPTAWPVPRLTAGAGLTAVSRASTPGQAGRVRVRRWKLFGRLRWRKPRWESEQPLPLSLTPTQGAADPGSRSGWRENRSGIELRHHAPRAVQSSVHTDAVRPYGLSFMRRTASASSRTGMIPTAGPKVSSHITRMPWFTWVSTAGSAEEPRPPPRRAPGEHPGPGGPRVTTTVPIVMATSSDPVRAGLVASLARPGGNVTGLTLDAGEAKPAGRNPRIGILRPGSPPDSLLEEFRQRLRRPCWRGRMK